jgi:hypothetical protein
MFRTTSLCFPVSIVALFVALQLTACRCEDSKKTPSPAAAVAAHAFPEDKRVPHPTLSGWGVFYKEDSDKHAILWLEGNYAAPVDVTVTNISFSAGPLPILNPVLYSDIAHPRTNWKRTLHVPWQGDQEYYIEVHYTYELAGYPPQQFSDIRKFTSIKESTPPIKATFKPKDASAFMVCTGTFNTTRHLALYDVVISFTGVLAHPQSHDDPVLSLITAYAGPSNPPTVQIWNQTQDLPIVHEAWAPGNLHSGFNGESEYYLKVHVEYETGQPPAENLPIATFEHTNMNQGTPIPLEPL